MPTTYPCPNPICPHTFSADEMRAGAVTCPRCNTTFAVQVPDAPPADPESPPTTALVRSRVQPRRNPLAGAFTWLLVGGLLTLLLVGVVVTLKTRIANFGGGKDALTDESLNFSFDKLDADGWARAAELKDQFPANLHWKKESPPAWAVFLARDYKTRKPKPEELLAEAKRRLAGYFEHLHVREPTDATLGGKPGRRVEFQGESGSVLMTGECLMCGHRGVGYWLVIWAPNDRVTDAASEFQRARNALTIGDGRAGWKEQTGDGPRFTAADNAVSLPDIDGNWSHYEPASDHAPEAKLALTPHRRKAHTPRRDPSALVVVFELPIGEEAMKEAKQFVQEWKRRNEAFADASLQPWKDGETPPTGGDGGPFGPPERLRVTGKTEQFGLLAAVEHRRKLWVLWCECAEPRDWEGDFRQLLDGARFGLE